MKQYEYRVFRDDPYLGSVKEDLFMQNWANKHGENGWHFFKIEWEVYRNYRDEDRYISIFAVGCRELTGSPYR